MSSPAPTLASARPAGLRHGLAMLRAEVGLHPVPFITAVVGAAVFAVATVASAFVVQWVTDEVIVPRFEEGEVATATVVTGCLAIIVVGLIRAVGVVIRRTYAGIAQWQIRSTVRTDVVERLQAQPLPWFHARPTGELVAHAGVDVDRATEVLAPLPFSSGVVVMVVVATVGLFLIDPVLGLVALVLFPALALLSVVYEQRVTEPAGAAQERIGDVSAFVHESFEGAMVVKALGAEAHESARLEPKIAALRDAKIRVAQLRATFEALLDAVPSLANVVLIVAGAYRVRAGAMTVGDLTAVVYLFTLLVWPLRLIGFVLGELPPSEAGWVRVRSVLDGPLEPPPTEALGRPPAGVAIALRNVRFGYEPGREVLRDVTLDVPEGRTVAVVGPTGAGKSTLLELMAGLVAADDGEVAVRPGGRAIVFQEPFLFAESIRENVLAGIQASDRRVRAALELAQAAGFVDELPAGLDTVVGERGITLSGGQRQRLALARALVRQPKLLLLDDATSSLDPTTEALILTGLRRELVGVTTVVVATRPSTITLADEVVFLAGGEVVDRGAHRDLMARQPAYAHLVEAYERDRAERGAAPR